jgi:hypothetical protein
MSVEARVKYLSIAELIAIFSYAHNRVEVVLWLRAIVCDRDRDRVRVHQVVLSRIILASFILKSIIL